MHDWLISGEHGTGLTFWDNEASESHEPCTTRGGGACLYPVGRPDRKDDMRLTKQQLLYQADVLKDNNLNSYFVPSKHLVEHMAKEIRLCHERISKKNSTLAAAGHELQETALALEVELNLSRWEHFKRAIWIRHF